MNRGQRPFRIVLTGPECTGKTTLTLELARELDLPCSEEAARRLARERGGLGARDIHDVARLQIELEDIAEARARARGAPAVLLDTDLVSTVAYGRFYYGACPEWIARAARARRGDLYLLLLPDVPFVPESGQRGECDERALQLPCFKEELARFGIDPIRIEGTGPARSEAARRALEPLVQALVHGG